MQTDRVIEKSNLQKYTSVQRIGHATSSWTDSECLELSDYNRAVSAPGEVLANARKLADPQTLCVVTGQQAGIFLTPLYILYKAIAAIRWARHLEETLKRPVVPVFWIASDDHDFEEIRRAHFLNRDGALETWTIRPQGLDLHDGRQAKSVFDIPIALSDVSEFFAEVDRKTNPTEFKQPILDLWRQIAANSSNMEDLFARLLMEHLGPHGLILLPARLAPLRQRAKPILRREIEQAGESSRLVREAGDRIKAEGIAPSLHRQGDELNFFLYRQDIRCKVTLADGQFQAAHPATGEILDSMTPDSLLAELEATPERFSPNVVLRPVVQDAALPTVAMVGGPGERRYLSQLQDVYRFFDITPCEVLPRPRALLIEPRIERQLKKYGLDAALLTTEDWPAIQDCFLRSGDFSAAIDAVDTLRRNQQDVMQQTLAQMGQAGETPAIQSAAQKTLGNILQAIDTLEKRIREEAERAQDISGGQWGKFHAALQPGGHPQERVLGPLAPFLINYGPRFTPWLVENLRIDTDTLQILYLSSMPPSDKNEVAQAAGK